MFDGPDHICTSCGHPASGDFHETSQAANDPQTIVPDVVTDLTVPPMFKHLIATYGKELTKDDVQRTLSAFRECLEQMDGRHDADLAALEAKGEENWTKDDFAKAGQIRRFHKNARTNVERIRKVVKNRALRTGQLIDGEANAMKGFCEERERRAEFIEQTEARRLQDERDALAEQRAGELIPFLAPGQSLPPLLGSMDSGIYEAVLTGMKASYDLRIEQERRAEADRIAREEADRIGREKAEKRLARVNQLSTLGLVRDELLRVYEFRNDDLPVHVADETIESMSDFEWDDMFQRIARDVNAIKARRIEAEERMRNERLEAANRLEALNREKLEREAAEKAEAERITAEQRAAELAPDKEKVDAYFKTVYATAMAVPDVANESLRRSLDRYFDSIANLTNNAAREAAGL
jgi:hypothetical protein